MKTESKTNSKKYFAIWALVDVAAVIIVYFLSLEVFPYITFKKYTPTEKCGNREMLGTVRTRQDIQGLQNQRI